MNPPKVIYYHFTPKEVKTLYEFFQHEFIDSNREDISDVVEHISKIVESNEFSTRDNKTT